MSLSLVSNKLLMKVTIDNTCCTCYGKVSLLEREIGNENVNEGNT